MERQRADRMLVDQGLAPTREKAQALIMAGSVWTGDRRVDKPGQQLDSLLTLEVRGPSLPYVSRGGLKLEKALDSFGIDPAGAVALDAGASTGGFTDCLLQRGARRVYAADVGVGQLDLKLRNDPRVVVMEKQNVRYLEALPEKVDLVTVDVSFISLGLVLPALVRQLKPEGRLVALVKPQFEAGKAQVGKGGVVRDPGVHQEVLRKVVEAARGQGLHLTDLTWSPVRGPAGNIEFLAGFQASEAKEAPSIHSTVEQAHLHYE